MSTKYEVTIYLCYSYRNAERSKSYSEIACPESTMLSLTHKIINNHLTYKCMYYPYDVRKSGRSLLHVFYKYFSKINKNRQAHSYSYRRGGRFV